MAILFWNFRGDLPVFLLFDRRLLKVFNDAVLDAPPQKVELGTRRRETMKIHTLGPAKRIKELLGVAVQTGLVGHVDRKHLTGRCRVCDVVRLGIVRHEPLEFPERNALAVLQNIVKFLPIFWYIKKFSQA